jgi:hypothetical protein
VRRQIFERISRKDYKSWEGTVKRAFLSPKLNLLAVLYIMKRSVYDVAARLGGYKYDHNVIFIAGMPMSATTWVKNMFAMVPGYFTRYHPMPDEVFIRCDFADSAFNYVPKYGYTLIKTHLNPTEENIDIILRGNVKKVVVTLRDLRDVVVARYHRLIKFPKKENEPHYKDYSRMTKEEAINHSIEIIIQDYIPWIEGWKNIARKHEDFVCFCEFENLRQNPKAEFMKMLSFYGIELSGDMIDEILEKTKGTGNMVDNLNRMASLPGGLSSNFRSGKIGGWKDEFTEKNKDYFKSLIEEKSIKLN